MIDNEQYKQNKEKFTTISFESYNIYNLLIVICSFYYMQLLCNFFDKQLLNKFKYKSLII